MKRIISSAVETGETKVRVVVPAPDSQSNGETEDDFLTRVQSRSVPDGATNIQIIEDSDVPTDRTFRDAWKATEKVIDVDMPKARVIKTELLRQERNEKFKPFDAAFRLADEKGDADARKAIGDKRQALRDMPATIQDDLNKLDTPDKLKAFNPSWQDNP